VRWMLGSVPTIDTAKVEAKAVSDASSIFSTLGLTLHLVKSVCEVSSQHVAFLVAAKTCSN